MASSRPRPRPRIVDGNEEAPEIPAATAPLAPAVPLSNACRTPSRYSLRFLSSAATRRSLLVGKYPSKTCQVMARTSDGTPDHAKSLRSERDTVLACNIFLNLLILAVRDACSSICFAVAFAGMEACVIRWREFAGSRSISWYWGRSIFPSTFFAVGYVGIPLSSAMSPLSIPRHAKDPDTVLALLPPASFAFDGCFRLPFLRMFAILGRPNSSSSSSNMSPSCSSSSSQS